MMQPTVDRGNLPAPLMTSEPGSFAQYTVVERMPQIVQQVIDDNPYSADIVRALRDLQDETGSRPIQPLEGPGADVAYWNDAMAAHIGGDWLSIPWYLAETYFYRRLLQATQYFQSGEWRGHDPFSKRKTEQEELAVAHLAEVWEELTDVDAQDLFELLILSCLWGNRVDLSNYKLAAGARAGLEARQERHNVLINHTDRVRSILSCGIDRLDFVNDNAGMDVLSDLVLSDFLIEWGWVQQAVFHVKSYPFYVSDAMPRDVLATIVLLERSPRPGVRAIGERYRERLQRGVFALKEHPFWTSAGSFFELPLYIHEELGQADLIILKGDVNYRRMLDDRHWPHDAHMEQVAPDFPRPFAMLRTLKGEIMVGLESGRSQELAAEDPDWLINGQRGVIHLVTNNRQP
ncbi:MAG: protein-glutamate O-methyltransferase family protein [Chloroflexi bacterium]|nr:protein-glutamate O-methyltransferase family protein [Chloroflexota bacterium]